jgi:hypothetical protein
MLSHPNYFTSIARTNGETFVSFIRNTASEFSIEGWGSDSTMLALSEVIGRPIHFINTSMGVEYLVFTRYALLDGPKPISLVLDSDHFTPLLPMVAESKIIKKDISSLTHQYKKIPFY